MEVGRIIARIDGSTGDFEKKMAGAQRTFEQTGTKMAASASRVSATVQKAYTDRIVAANAAASKEIEAAQRTLRARLRASQDSGEVNAARKMYAERVALARSAAQQEIALAQSAHLAATQGLRPVVTAMSSMTKVAGKAGPGLQSVRGAMTAVLQGALHLVPGIGSLTGILGSMALGSGLMIGVMAGVAALAFAWKGLTANARRIKDAAVEASKAIDELGKTATSKLAEQMGALNEELDRLESKQGLLSRIANVLGATGQGALAGILGREAVTAGTGQQAALDRIKKAEEEIVRLNKADRLAAEKEIYDLQIQHIRDKYARMTAENASFVFALEVDMKRRFGLVGPLRLPGRNVSAIQAGKPNLPSFGTIRAVEPLSEAGIRAARGPGFLSGLGGQLKGMLDPKMILSGLVTGGLSMVIGAVTGGLGKLVGGLLESGHVSKEFARQLKEAGIALSRSIALTRAGLQGDTARERELSAMDAMRKWVDEWNKTAGPLTQIKVPDFTTYAEMQAWFDMFRPGLWESMSEEARQRWLEIVGISRDLGESLKKTGDAVDRVTASMTNVPEGFKIAYARFNATTGAPMSGPNLPGFPAGGGITVHGDINVNGASARSGRELLELIETEVVRKRATGGGGLTLDFA